MMSWSMLKLILRSRYWQTWAFFLQNFFISNHHITSSYPLLYFFYIKQVWMSPELWETLQKLWASSQNFLVFPQFWWTMSLWEYDLLSCSCAFPHIVEVPWNTETKPLKDESIGFLSLLLHFIWIVKTFDILQKSEDSIWSLMMSTMLKVKAEEKKG